MRRSIKTLAVLGLGTALAVLPATFANAAERHATASTVLDAPADATTSGGAPVGMARAYDIQKTVVQTHFADNGLLFVEVVVEVKNTSFEVDNRRVVSSINVDAATDYTAVVDVQIGTKPHTGFKINGVKKSCGGVSLTNYQASNRLVVLVPSTCFPGGNGLFKANSRVVTTKGAGATNDVSASTTGRSNLSYEPFRTGKMTEAAGDVDYGSRPGADRGAGRSIDILKANVAYTTANTTLRTTFEVLDLTTRSYQTRQEFTLGLRDGLDETIGTVTVRPDLSGQGKHAFTTTGFTCTGLRLSRLDAKADTVAIDVPRSCFGSRRAVQVLALSAAYDAADGLLGLDATPISPLISLK